MGYSGVKKPYLDYLKAIACILVVLGHAISYFDGHVGPPAFGWMALSTLIYAVHVPLFFVIAGYLCHRQPLQAYARKKFFRILIPFLTFTLLKLLYSRFISPDLSHQQGFWPGLLNAMVTGDLYWFMYAILLMYAAAPLFWERSSPAPSSLLWTEAGVFSGLFVFSCFFTLTGRQLPSVLQLQNTVLNFPFFLAGMMIRQREEGFLRFFRKGLPWLLGFSALCAAAGVLLYRHTLLPLIYPVGTVLAFALMIPLYAAAKACRRELSLFRDIGRFSLQIMLLDSFFKVLLFGLWARFFPTPAVMIPVFTTADVLLGLLVCRVCRKIPVVRTLLGL